CSVCCVCSDRQSSTSIFTLSLHDALPICLSTVVGSCQRLRSMGFTSRKPSTCWMGTPDSATSRESQAASAARPAGVRLQNVMGRSEEHTSELQSRENLVCRLLLEKKNISM